jgi:hypothetical protein
MPKSKIAAPTNIKRGRKTNLNAQLQHKICNLLERGHTVATTCGATGISERSFHDYCATNAAFLAATQRARAAGRVRIVESILDSDDWRARAWYLERTAPHEFGRSVERPLPQPEPDKRRLSFALVLQMPDGTQRETTFKEAEKIFCNFPRRDEPPTDEGKSSPAPESDDEIFDSLDESRSDE